jgi:hypothetical protein
MIIALTYCVSVMILNSGRSVSRVFYIINIINIIIPYFALVQNFSSFQGLCLFLMPHGGFFIASELLSVGKWDLA